MGDDPMEAITPERLAAIDQWHAARLGDINGLITAAQADIARECPISRAVEAALLSATVRAHPIGRDGLADLLAVLLVRIIRGETDVQ